ncbi:MAG TPA: hypothetical protein VKX28_21190 [Xanthobacteraceae bacterium]|nr:hypothetical protein [Xanthobacteraceae bacterium]
MISRAQRRANRDNAARSTGPRTRAGKTTAARNAWRHGLSLPVLADAALAPEVAALARAIAGEGASAASRTAATRIAEAQIDLVRVRSVRLAATQRLLEGADVAREILRLDRYERRALFRRSRALEAFCGAAWDDLRSRKAQR